MQLTDYHEFGMTMQGRSFMSSTGYRYGYQGSEKDKEINSGAYTTDFRGLDVRIGRWLSPDPIINPSASPYNSMGNDPIGRTDVLGLKDDPTACENFGNGGGGDAGRNSMGGGSAAISGPNAGLTQAFSQEQAAGQGDKNKAPEPTKQKSTPILDGPIFISVLKPLTPLPQQNAVVDRMEPIPVFLDMSAIIAPPPFSLPLLDIPPVAKAEVKDDGKIDWAGISKTLGSIAGKAAGFGKPLAEGFSRANKYGIPKVGTTTQIIYKLKFFGHQVFQQNLFAMSTKWAGRLAFGAKLLSKGIGALGAVAGVMDMIVNKVTVTNCLNVGMSILALTGVGTVVYTSYFLTNAILEHYTGKQIGDYITQGANLAVDAYNKK